MPILLNKSIVQAFFNAVATGTQTSSTYVAPATANLISYQSIFGTPPASITLLIEGSSDGVSWSTLATLNTIGGQSGNITTSLPFLRARISAISGGALITLNVIAKPYTIQNLTEVTAGLDGSIAQYETAYGSAADTIGGVAPGTAGQVLTSNGNAAAPSYQDAGGGSIAGSIAENQIAVGFGADEIAGDDNLLWDGTKLNLFDFAFIVDGYGRATSKSPDGNNTSSFSLIREDPFQHDMNIRAWHGLEVAGLIIETLFAADSITLQTNGGNIILLGLPTEDPGVAGALWNSSGTVKVSAG